MKCMWPRVGGATEITKVMDSLAAHLAALLKPPPGLSSADSVLSLEAWCEETRWATHISPSQATGS